MKILILTILLSTSINAWACQPPRSAYFAQAAELMEVFNTDAISFELDNLAGRFARVSGFKEIMGGYEIQLSNDKVLKLKRNWGLSRGCPRFLGFTIVK